MRARSSLAVLVAVLSVALPSNTQAVSSLLGVSALLRKTIYARDKTLRGRFPPGLSWAFCCCETWWQGQSHLYCVSTPDVVQTAGGRARSLRA